MAELTDNSKPWAAPKEPYASREKVKEGQVFGRLTTHSRAYKRGNKRYWNCQCSCGGSKVVWVHDLLSGHTKSCGCLSKEMTVSRSAKHGAAPRQEQKRLWRIWAGMIARCKGGTYEKEYRNYHNRGITVCSEWHDYVSFEAWALSNGYKSDLTIDRKDNDGNYCPENCRWATNEQQANNTRKNVWVEAFGDRKTLAQWARDPRSKVSAQSIGRRIRAGWSGEQSVSLAAHSGINSAAEGGCAVKTLQELENDVRQCTSKFLELGRRHPMGSDSYIEHREVAQKAQATLFADLATIHALASMQAEALRTELRKLEALRDARKDYERVQLAGYIKCDEYVKWGPRNGYGEVTDAAITEAGLARIAEIKGLLGESEGTV